MITKAALWPKRVAALVGSNKVFFSSGSLRLSWFYGGRKDVNPIPNCVGARGYFVWFWRSEMRRDIEKSFNIVSPGHRSLAGSVR